MLKIEDRKHLREVFQFARRIGMIDQLKDQLRRLDTYAENDERGATRCRLFKDFAPYSFFFRMDLDRAHVNSPDAHVFDRDGYTDWFCGGLIFHGAHDNGGDGGAPTFSVSLVPTSGWSIHT